MKKLKDRYQRNDSVQNMHRRICEGQNYLSIGDTMKFVVQSNKITSIFYRIVSQTSCYKKVWVFEQYCWYLHGLLHRLMSQNWTVWIDQCNYQAARFTIGEVDSRVKDSVFSTVAGKCTCGYQAIDHPCGRPLSQIVSSAFVFRGDDCAFSARTQFNTLADQYQ